jgi:hypothetical protein
MSGATDLTADLQRSIFRSPVEDVVAASAAYDPDSIREYVAQVLTLPGCLDLLGAAVGVLGERGRADLPLDPALVEHLTRIQDALSTTARALSQDGERVLTDLRTREQQAGGDRR